VSATTLARKASKAAVLPAGVATRRRTGDVVILLYHRVGTGTAEIELPPGVFEAQIAHLAAAGVRTLDEALAGAGGVVVTFDDGTVDLHEAVLPVLDRVGVTATLYLATGMVREEGGQGLSWSQIREAVDAGLVTVGSHTHTHADLSRATEAQAEEEMRRSKELIEDRLGVACRNFAYPWAVGSAGAERAARRLFDSAALDAWRTNRAGRIDPYRLGRTPVLRSDGMTFFRAKARGYLDGEAWLYRVARRGPWGRTG
jgi:peptidoglycan/xylan/chitin deacetylase (PgdA/CDA1 family)